MALQPLTKSAGTGLHVAGALAGIHAAEVITEPGEIPVLAGHVAAGDINMEDPIAVRGSPFQEGYRAGDRADVMAEARERLLRRDYAVPPVAGERFCAAFQDRRPERTCFLVVASAARRAVGQPNQRMSYQPPGGHVESL